MKHKLIGNNYDKLLKDEKKKVSEEHQADIREALKIVKPIG